MNTRTYLLDCVVSTAKVCVYAGSPSTAHLLHALDVQNVLLSSRRNRSLVVERSSNIIINIIELWGTGPHVKYTVLDGLHHVYHCSTVK